MPDEPRRGGPGPGGDHASQDDQPTGRRRRSLDDGGLSVSELLEQHSRSNNPRPAPPGPADTGRRAAPEPPAPPAGPAPNGTRSPAPPPAPESTGRRAAPDHFTPSAPDRVTPAPNGEPPRRPAAPNDFFAPAPAHEGTGTRTPRPMPEDGPRRAANSRPAEVRHPGEGTGRRARPEPPEAPGGGRRAAEPPRRYAEVTRTRSARSAASRAPGRAASR
ncbi:hypothetical protein K7G98_17930 [Saccharothrix sp. MB29]|nr:hypothetical protein [Saccharothrix sp. MB29]